MRRVARSPWRRTGTAGGRPRRSWQRSPALAKGTLLTAALVPLALAAGCSEGGGVRVEGTASTSVMSPPPTSAAPAPKVDAVGLLRSDPQVGRDIKADLKPCGGREYPIDTSYGAVTGGPVPDVVINVATCGDGVWLGGYVYRMENGRYVDVFKDEQSPVYVQIVKHDLQVTHQIYRADDPVCCPSSEDVVTYHWNGSGFAETSRIHSVYGKRTYG